MPEAREKLVGEMNETEFNALIEKFIERETEGTGEVPAEVLFEALPDFLAAMAESAQAVEMTGEVLGDRLVLSTPHDLPAGVREIEVRLPHVRVVVSLEPAG
jgi:hypothetical protein